MAESQTFAASVRFGTREHCLCMPLTQTENIMSDALTRTAFAMLLALFSSSTLADNVSGVFTTKGKQFKPTHATLCALIEDCLDSEPTQRPASAAALSMKLAGLLHAHAPKATPSTAFVALAVASAALVAIAVLLLRPILSPPAWETSVQFLRAEFAGNVEIAANSTLHVGDRLRMSMRSSRDAYVYVLNEDAAGNATVLFPGVGELRNPVHANATLLLPGGEHTTLAGEVTGDSAR